MKKLLFIYNPTSGKGRVADGLATILNTFARTGWLTTVYPTQCKGDAARAARELGPHFDRVVCAGGDGTLRKQPVKKAVKIGRNDPCPCGSGLKWKKCTCKEYHD